ncbi:unnamed protein product, partial [Enterobius vermicularis]|uniref:Derlin n=1 Tax=Enterobius vermicularis TaxID=51028 RepID=A0A0N4V5B2_ENTVE
RIKTQSFQNVHRLKTTPAVREAHKETPSRTGQTVLESQRSVGEPQREKTSGPIFLCHQSFDDYFRWRLNYLRKPVLVMANVAFFNGIWCLDVSNAALRYKDVHAVNFPTFAYDFKGLITLKRTLIPNLLTPMTQIIFSFEYVWTAKGINVTRRLDMIERQWAYYAGFGAIMAILSMIWTDVVLNSFIFGMSFPFFIIESSNYLPLFLLPKVPLPFHFVLFHC